MLPACRGQHWCPEKQARPPPAGLLLLARSSGASSRGRCLSGLPLARAPRFLPDPSWRRRPVLQEASSGCFRPAPGRSRSLLPAGPGTLARPVPEASGALHTQAPAPRSVLRVGLGASRAPEAPEAARSLARPLSETGRPWPWGTSWPEPVVVTRSGEREPRRTAAGQGDSVSTVSAGPSQPRCPLPRPRSGHGPRFPAEPQPEATFRADEGAPAVTAQEAVGRPCPGPQRELRAGVPGGSRGRWLPHAVTSNAVRKQRGRSRGTSPSERLGHRAEVPTGVRPTPTASGDDPAGQAQGRGGPT